jgi:beta-catenin-like protein 1
MYPTLIKDFLFQIKARILQLLSLHGGSVKSIRNVMREYAGHIGMEEGKERGASPMDEDAEDEKEAEQQRILQLVDKF